MAGAVVSGSFFGDKISPLSDTTNLAAAVTETNVFDHIRNMMPTTVPAMLIAFAIYLLVGGQSGVDT
jgi:NhaC family Na+:H+ antiporter